MQKHWNETKSFIKDNWPKFSNTEISKINGNFDQFLFHLKDIYGGFPLTEAMARTKLQKFFNTIENEHPETIDD